MQNRSHSTITNTITNTITTYYHKFYHEFNHKFCPPVVTIQVQLRNVGTISAKLALSKSGFGPNFAKRRIFRTPFHDQNPLYSKRRLETTIKNPQTCLAKISPIFSRNQLGEAILLGGKFKVPLVSRHKIWSKKFLFASILPNVFKET